MIDCVETQLFNIALSEFIAAQTKSVPMFFHTNLFIRKIDRNNIFKNCLHDIRRIEAKYGENSNK